MVKILQKRTQPITLYKVRAHVNIDSNEKTYKLAKEGLELEHRIATHPYEHAHATPYYYQKDIWASMDDVPDKGPVRFLEKQIIKYDMETNLAIMATQTPNTCKWTENTDINNELSNEFWANPAITGKQKSCLLKFRTGTYMGNARKQMFFGHQSYPTITCPICHSNEPDTWLHVLLTCKQQHIHSLRVKRHNKAVGEIRKLLISSEKSRCFTLMNAGTFNNSPQENTVPNWLLPCTCNTQRCHCNARFRPDLLCVKGLPYQNAPPRDIDPNLTIQFIEFTYCNDRFSPAAIEAKNNKYNPLIASIASRGWKIKPLIVITASARATAHIPSMKTLETNFKIPMATIKNTFKILTPLQYNMPCPSSSMKGELKTTNHSPKIQTPHNSELES
jgi:hypothetical protein